MPEAIAFYDPGADITCEHTAGAQGGLGVSWPTARNTGGPAGISDTGDGILVVTNPAAKAQIFGVTSHDVAAGRKVNIMRAPKVVPMQCAAAVALGDNVATDATGKAIKSVTGDIVIGKAVMAGSTTVMAAIDLYHSPYLQP